MQGVKSSDEEIKKKNYKRTKRKIRRKNAELYPIYKMFSWDLLCFYSIQFLFYTMTKKIDASEILMVNAVYLLSKIIMEIPSVTIVDLCGHRKSLIIGNFLVFLNMIALIFIPGFAGVIISNIIFAFGYDIKTIAETNLLYDSVSTRGGEGLYSEIDARGGSWYCYLDGILSLMAGYLFVINNYIPIYICAACALISTIMSFRFEDVHKKKKEESKNLNTTVKEYATDLKTAVKFILNSNRMKSYIIFGSIFYGIIKIIGTYKSEILLNQGVTETEFSTIFAILTLLSGITTAQSKKMHKKFRNKTLSVLSLAYVGAAIIIALSVRIFSNNITIPIIILMCAVFKAGDSLWYILEYKYLKNFTTEKMRNKIMFTYEAITCIVASFMSFLGSLLLKVADIKQAFLIAALVSFMIVVLSLDYMRPRIGLKPSQYKNTDIEFE